MATRALPAALLPNLAAMLTIATLAYCLLVYGAGERFFRDSDSGWHIRTGEWILAQRALPQADPYSFSKAGQPWVTWEWGSDVLMGLAHRVDGLRGVTVLIALAIAACTWLWCRLSFVAGGDFFLAAAFAPLMITTASLHWLARPHVFSWLFIMGSVLYAERLPARIGPGHLAAVAGFTALWASLHASFFLAPLIALVYALAHAVRPLLWKVDQDAESRSARSFLWLALAALLGSLLNPYGWRLHAHVLSYLGNEELTSRIAEFQSFNFHTGEATQITLTLLVAMAGAVFALSQQKLAHFLLAVMFISAGLRSARVLPLVALAILPLANAAFANALRASSELRPRIQRVLDRALAYSSRVSRIDRSIGGVAFAGLAAAVLLLMLYTPSFSNDIGFSSSRFPVDAAAAVEKLPIDARVLAPDSFGGYLIYRFKGTRKVYFDGRSDFYGADFMKQYLLLITARPGWMEVARSFRFTHALLPGDSALKAALEQAGWTAKYRDKVATLLEAH